MEAEDQTASTSSAGSRALPGLLFAIIVAICLWSLGNVANVLRGDGLRAAGPFDGMGVQRPAVTPTIAQPRTREGAVAPRTAEAAASSVVQPFDSKVVEATDPAKGSPAETARVAKDSEMLSVLVFLCGCLGATLHALGSLVAFAGLGTFKSSWTLWYLAQPLRGAILASGFFWLVQGGLFGGIAANLPVNVVAMMGATFLVGLFSDPAIEKLKEVFQVLFKTEGGRAADGVPKAPVIRKAAYESGPPAQVKVEGTGFSATDVVKVNGQVVSVSRRDAGTMDIDISPPAQKGAQLTIVVEQTGPRAQSSKAFALVVP